MKKLLAAALPVLLSALLGACSNPGGATSAGGAPGQLRVALDGNTSLAQIEIQNVFDPSQVFLVDCTKKDHLLNGEPFCDELTVLPPGVYEVKVQPEDPTCRSEQDHYKVIVREGATVEITVPIVCGSANGGLDVIVTTTETPVITNIDFTFEGSKERANKFICQDSAQCPGNADVRVGISVTDSDTACEDLTATWKAVDSNGNDITATLLSDIQSIPGDPCRFTALVDSSVNLGDYTITFTVSDGKNPPTTLTFPIHVIDCGCPADGGVTDGGVTDGGVTDGGVTDGGLTDGGLTDGGQPDAGQDAGTLYVDTGSVTGAYDGGTFGDSDPAYFTSFGPVADAGAPPPNLLVLNPPTSPSAFTTIDSINMGNLTDYLFFFADGRDDANWQGATKGFVGDVAVDGIQADERTSGTVPYAGNMYTNDSTFDAWQDILDANVGQATGFTNEVARISGLETDLASAFTQINALPATPGFTSVSSTSLNGLNTLNGTDETYVINVTSGFTVSTKIFITGDPGDVYILRWDTDANSANGYQGQVKFQSGGAIVPNGAGMTPANFINVAGELASSGGGTNPASPYPQGPRFNNGQGSLCTGCSNFAGGGFFTGYWLTTGVPTIAGPAGLLIGSQTSLSNGIFVGGWYTFATQFSMTSGTSGVYVAPNPPTVPTPAIDLEKFVSPDNGTTFFDADTAPGPTVLSSVNPKFRFTVTNTGGEVLHNIQVTDSVLGVIGTVPGTLAPGASYTFPDVIGTWQAGQHTNTGIVSALSPTNAPVGDTDPANYFGAVGAIDLIKYVSEDGFNWFDANSEPGIFINAGTNPKFLYEVTNTGEVDLHNITVTDSDLGVIGTIPFLAVGDTEFLMATGTWAAGQQHNLGTATGFDTNDNEVSDTDPANYYGAQNPGLDIEKLVSVDNGQNFVDADTAPGPTLPPGVVPQFKFIVKNTGQTPMYNVFVTDDVFGFIGFIPFMAPGDTAEFTRIGLP